MKMRLFLLVSTLCLACAVPWQDAEATVTKAALKASPAAFRGDCPGVITFNGLITSNKAGIVKYVFTRSDGAIDTITKSLVFKAAGTKKVSDTWTLGGSSLPYYKGWKAIKIISPNAMTSPKANFEVRCNPPLNSAKAAHGNTDWHIDTANEFLFGVDMAGTATAANHAPAGWSRMHIHVGVTNASKYYYDKTLSATGEDTNLSSGIDKSMLFFYAGHGSPVLWNTLGDNATQGFMSLGNVEEGGMLRYYWQCSCEVFAHGPKTCAGGGMEYACPQNFSGTTDSVNMRNVFKRWGPVLRPDLRMACGMSTSAYCHESNVNKVWDNYNNVGMGVADSFIDGFGDWGVVPLCITMGGANIAATPLYDAKFTNAPNLSGKTHYHIMYAAGTGTAPVTSKEPRAIPETLPRFKVVPAEVPARLRGLIQPSTAPFERFAGGKAVVRIEEASGAIYLTSESIPSVKEKSIEENDYLDRASSLVREMGWETNDLGKPTVTRLMTASMPVGGKDGDISKSQKGVLVTFRRQIDADGRRIDVLGEGGVINVVMTNGGLVLNASRVWRSIASMSSPARIRTFEEARNEAIKKLGRPDAYDLDQWRWGYKELSGVVKQDELQVVFQFSFVPKKHEDLLEYPPRIVEVSGQKE